MNSSAEWNASVDVGAMLEAVGETAGDHPDRAFYGQAPVRATERQLRLWCAALLDLATHDDPNRENMVPWRAGLPYEDEPPLAPISTARKWADPEYDRPGDPPMALRAHLLRDVVGDPWHPVVLPQKKCLRCGGKPRGVRSPLGGWITCPKCVGRLTVADAPWLTPTVLSLAETCHEGDWSALVPLSDALEEAGMPDGSLLRHLRGEQRQAFPGKEDDRAWDIWVHLRGPHCRGCWAISLLTLRTTS